MPSLKPNLVKRIDRLPKPTMTSEALQPLFEAVSNAIQSTQDRFGDDVPTAGRITIDVGISRREKLDAATIVDNGFGLDDKNFEAFCTTDTDNKIARGGKGVGRLLWLDCFDEIHVESTYRDATGPAHREFDFCLAMDEQIQSFRETRLADNPSTGMSVTFRGLRDNGYREHFPGRATFVFQHLASHFLPTFIGSRSPLVTVHCGDETRTYPQDIESLIFRRLDKDHPPGEFGSLRLILLECDKVLSANLKGNHFIHFIGNDRTVVSQKIDAKLGLKAFGQGEDRVFHGCVFGSFLDKSVNQERTGFTFGEKTVERIVTEICMPYVDDFLGEPLTELKEEQGEIVRTITVKYPSVAFGGIDELQEHLPSGELSDDAIYGHLSRERFRRDAAQEKRIKEVLDRIRGGDLDGDSFAERLREASEAIEDSERKSLAEYIVRRKTVLDFVELLLKRVRNEEVDAAFQREELLHSFICPVRTKTVGAGKPLIQPASSHDLWLIDERLTFAKYFSSDVPFTDLVVGVDSTDRPDLVVFDRVHGLRQKPGDSRVLLVEFKRPTRRAYPEDENPIEQIQGYVEKLQSGQLTDVNGRPIRLGEDAIFNCFIVADIVGKMDTWTQLWPRTPDGRGRFLQPQGGFRGTIEVIGWDSLIEDARERNAAFFDSAGLSLGSIFES